MAPHLFARLLGAHAEADRHTVWTEPESQVIGRAGRNVEQRTTGTPEAHDDLRRRHRHPLACADQEWHARPARRIDVEPERCVGFDRGICGNVRFFAVTRVLATYDVTGARGLDRPQYPDLLVAHRVARIARRWLHGEQTHDLQQVILHYVADRPQLLVEPAAALNSERLRHRELHARDVPAIPDWLEEGVRETEVQQVLHRLLAEKMIDAENLRLVEHLTEAAVERPRGFQIATERFLHYDPRAAGTAGFAQPRHHLGEQTRWDGEIVQRSARLAQRIPEHPERGGIAVIAPDVVQALT